MQGETANIELGVTAVQGNAKVDTETTVLETIPENATVYEVATGTEVNNALAAGNGYIALKNDVALNKSNNNTLKDVTKNAEINLNDHTLATDMDFRIFSGADVTISNGTWDASNIEGNYEVFSVIGNVAGLHFTLDGVNVIGNYSAIGLQNYAWKGLAVEEQPVVTVKNSTITCLDPYGSALGTNASLGNTGNYNVGADWVGKPIFVGGKAVFENCTINAATGIILTGPTTLEMSDCTINSKLQSIVVRGGDVTLTRCNLNNKGYSKVGLKEMIEDGHEGFMFINTHYEVGAEGVKSATEWQQANDVNLAGIVLGSNNTGAAYQFEPTLTLIDTTVTVDENTPDGKVFVCAREGFDVTLSHSGCNLTAEDITKAGSIENVIVNG